MDHFYQHDFYVGADIAGVKLQLRPAGMLSILQEGATRAALEFQGSSPEMYEKYKVLWMVTRIWYHLDRPLLWDETVTLKTWHRADRGAMLYRDYDLSVGGKGVGEAVAAWVLVDEDTRKLRKMTDFPEIAASGGGSLCKDSKLRSLRLPEGLTLAQERTFHYSDLDNNGHVNNVHYANLCADAIELQRYLGDSFVSDFQIDYKRECMAGETIGVCVVEADGAFFIRGEGAGKESRFEAQMALDKLPGAV